MSTMSDFVNSGASNQAQVDANTKILQYMPNRNRVINGKMEVAQKGTSFTLTTATVGYHIDRFRHHMLSDTCVLTVSQQDNAPTGFKSSLQSYVSTADTTIAATEHCSIGHHIEGYNISDLVGITFTLSFWVKSTKTGIYSICLRNGPTDLSYVSEYTINVANTWEFKKLTVHGGIPASGTWNFTNGVGLSLIFALAMGSNYITSTLNQWIVGNKNATQNQINFLDTGGNTFNITGIQLEAGEVATPFEHRPYGQELALCQRYFYRSEPIIYSGPSPINIANGPAFVFPFKVTMRAIPTATLNPLITDANFVSSNPTSGKWSMSVTGGWYPVKTGVVTITAISSLECVMIYTAVATFDRPVNRLHINDTHIFDASAEL